MPDITIVSGGQTGVDRAALDVARELGLPHAGWIPQGRRAEDGVIPPEYDGLRETDAPQYFDRTERNVRESDATILLCFGMPIGGTRFTLDLTTQLGRPRLVVDLLRIAPAVAAERIRAWLRPRQGIRRLNIAGPRASEARDGYARAREVLQLALASS